MIRKKVMVFGVFDGLHAGHHEFLHQAKQCGNYLIAIVTPDNVVQELKGKRPKLTIAERFEHLKDIDHVDAVVVGDNVLGSWYVLDLHRPKVIALGYDQIRLKDELERYFKNADWQADIKLMHAHEGDKYHSSILKDVKKPIQ